MKHVLVISFSNLATDPRVNRQLRWLVGNYRVTAAGLVDPEIPRVEFVPLARSAKGLIGKGVSAVRLLARQYDKFYWGDPKILNYLGILAPLRPDLVIANDLETLPLALKLANGAKVMFDAHEYAPGQFDDKLLFRIFRKDYRSQLCREYIPQAHAMVTVSQGICDAYTRDTGVRPGLITNAPDFIGLSPQRVNGDKIRLVHHGAAIDSRRVENMILMMDHVDSRFELSLILTQASKPYFERLQKMVAVRDNVVIRPPVPMRTLAEHLNQFDIGVYLLEPLNFNSRHALPNKLFEFVQARLAVAVGPSPEMASVVEKHDLGIVSTDFSPRSLANELNRLSVREIEEYKERSHTAARELSAETNAEKFLPLVEQLLIR
jgi:hypothetical protein